MTELPRKIVLGIETSGPGGAERTVLHLADGLRGLGIEVIMATMQRGWMTERAEDLGVPVWIEPQGKGLDPRWVWRLRSRLAREGIDLFHGHEYEMNVYGGLAARLAGLPTIATLHGSVAGTEARHTLVYRVLRLLGQRPIAVSNDLWTSLAPSLGWSSRTPQVIHTGTSVPPRLHADRRQQIRVEARRELGIAGSGPLLLAIGNLYPVKDHATLLRAAAALEDARIAIAGRGSEHENLVQLGAELGLADRLHLLGLRDDIPRLLAAADILVHPSLSEGLPLAILEAMASQTPVVATRVGGVSEAVDHGRTGLLVPAGDPRALAAALRELLDKDDLRMRFADAAWERASREFSVESMSAHYLAVYQQCFEG